MARQTGATAAPKSRSSSTAPPHRLASSLRPASGTLERPQDTNLPKIIRVGSTSNLQSPLLAHTAGDPDLNSQPQSRISISGTSILPPSLSGSKGAGGPATGVGTGRRKAPLEDDGEGDRTYREADTGTTTIDIGGDVTKDTQDKDMPNSPIVDRRNPEIRDRRQEGTWGISRGDGTNPEPTGTPRQATVANNKELDGNYSETRGDGTRKKISVKEQLEIDFEMLKAVMDNKKRHKALIRYQSCMEATGKGIRFKEYADGPTKKALEGKASTVADKAKRKERADGKQCALLGVSVKDLEGKKKTHTSAQTPAKPSLTRGMPSGGYLHKRLVDKKGGVEGADPDDEGSGSSSSSSSDSSDEDIDNMLPREIAKRLKKLKRNRKERKHKEKLRRLQLSGFKAKLPTPYKGKPNYDLYEQFVYKITTWIEDTGFNNREVVKHVKGFLKGKASEFYMSHVAPEIQEYTMTMVFRKLFEYCFLLDVKARLRKQFQRTVQGNWGFKDCARKLKKLQWRIIDISNKQVAQQLWDGAHRYIRIDWVKAGYSAEENTVTELEESAVRFEAAEKIHQTEQNKTNEYKDQRDKYKSYNDKPKNTNETNTSTKNPNNSYKPKEEGDWGNGKARLLPEKAAEYRVAGKYFNYSKVGHTVKDCPKRNSVKPKGIASSSISFARIHELEQAKDGVLKVNTVTIKEVTDLDAYLYQEGPKQNPKALLKEISDLEVYAVKKEVKPLMEWNSAKPKDMEQKVPRPIVLEVLINGNPA